jgi:hypothetical protein
MDCQGRGQRLQEARALLAGSTVGAELHRWYPRIFQCSHTRGTGTRRVRRDALYFKHGLTVVSEILLRRQQARECGTPLYLPRNGSTAVDGFNAFTEVEGDYH